MCGGVSHPLDKGDLLGEFPANIDKFIAQMLFNVRFEQAVDEMVVSAKHCFVCEQTSHLKTLSHLRESEA